MNFSHRLRLCLFAIVSIFGARTVMAEVALQYHCAGGMQLAADNRLTSLHKVLNLPSTINFENIALAKFARSLTDGLRFGNNPSSALLIKPLLKDVIQRESLCSYGEVASNGSSFILALPLEPARVQFWQESFAKLFGGAGDDFSSEGFKGRRWRAGGSNFYWTIPAKDWLLAGSGDDFSSLRNEYLGEIKAHGRPAPALTESWLKADLSAGSLGGCFHVLKPARINVTIAIKEDDLHLNARLLEAEAIPWKPEPWRIPKELIRGQIISFVAGENVAAFLNINPAVSRLASNPMTNQFYVWALDQMPLLNYMAWPVDHASNALQQLSAEAPAALNPILKRFNGTELNWDSKAGRLLWLNMRLFVPSLSVLKEAEGEFLFLASFPRTANSKPLSDALVGQIQSHSDLVYYDWELTCSRLAELQILGRIIANRAEGQTSDVTDAYFIEGRWLGDVAHLAATTVTEITHSAPNELSVERKAPMGFTAVELVLLADWLCDANSGPIHSPPSAPSLSPLQKHP